MQWDPSLLAIHNPLWLVAISWVIGLPLVFGLFLVLASTGIASVEMTTQMVERELQSAGPIRRFAWAFLWGPLLAVFGQMLLTIGLLAAFSGAYSER